MVTATQKSSEILQNHNSTMHGMSNRKMFSCRTLSSALHQTAAKKKKNNPDKNTVTSFARHSTCNKHLVPLKYNLL